MRKLIPFILCLLVTAVINAQSWKAWQDSAAVYVKQGDAEKAASFYEKARTELPKDSTGTNSQANLLYTLAELYSNNDMYERAEPLYRQALTVIEKLNGKGDKYAKVCKSLGTLYFYTSNFEKADSFFTVSLQVREKLFGKEHVLYAESCNSLGVLNAERGNYEKAAFYHLEAARIRRNVLGTERREYAQSCENLAIVYVSTGQNAKAEALFTEARGIYSRVLGTQHPAYLDCYNNLASLYYEMRLYEKAEPSLLEILSIREKTIGKDHPDYAITCNNLANLYGDIGQDEKARLLASESRRIWGNTTGKESPYYAFSCINLAAVYQRLDSFDKAEPLFLEAQQIVEKALGKEHTNYAKICGNLASLYSKKGQNEKAEALYTQARAIWEKVLGKEHPDYAKSCRSLASLYEDLGQYGKAEPLYLEAGEIWKRTLGKGHADYKINSQRLANLYRNTGDPKALTYFIEAFNVERNIRERIFSFTSESEKQFYIKDKKDYNDEFMSFAVADSRFHDKGFAYEVSLDGRNIILSSVQQLRQAIHSSGDTLLMNRYNEWIAAKEQVAFWMTKPAGERNKKDSLYQERAKELEKDLTRASHEFKAQQQQVSWKDIQASLKPGEASVEFLDFQYYDGKRLSDSTYYIALVLRKDKPVPEIVKLFEQRQLDSLTGKRNAGAGYPLLNQVYASRGNSKSLYDIIWKPLEARLEGIKKVYYAPAGSLFKISFAALPVNAKEVLSDRYSLVQLNSTAAINDPGEEMISVTDKIMLYGAVQYDIDSATMRLAAMESAANEIASRSLPDDLSRDGVPGFRYLEGTGKEISSILKLAEQDRYSLTLKEGRFATEESIKSMNGKNSPTVLHIATHGFFFPDPINSRVSKRERGYEIFRYSDNPLIRSGLAFAGANNAWGGKPVKGVEDGILTSYEVSNMYLPQTRLAVLSACETGLGDIQGSEGVYGLQRAFKIAGVKNLVMSLWKVPDAETTEFMEAFYKSLFTGKTIQQAFYNAQASMKNKYRNDPFKWAAWVLIR